MDESIKPRIFKFDNIKLLIVTLIVIGSFADTFTDKSDMFRSWFIFATSFTAPMFIFLSGLFQKPFQKGQRPDLHKISTFLILGYLLKLIIYLLRIWNGEKATLDLFGGDSIEWYFFVIGMYIFTLFVLQKVHRYALLTASVILGIAAGYLPLGDRFYLMRYFVFLPFYVAGYYLTPARIRRFSHQINVKLGGIAFLIAYFIICFRSRDVIYPLRELFTGNQPYASVSIPGCTFWHRMLCYGISAVMIISVAGCIPNRKAPVLTRMGRNSTGVLFWHYPVMLLLWHFGLFDLLLPLGDPLWKFVVITVAIITSLILSLSVFMWPLRKMQTAFGKLPVAACVITDCVILLAAAAAQLFLLK